MSEYKTDKGSIPLVAATLTAAVMASQSGNVAIGADRAVVLYKEIATALSGDTSYTLKNVAG